MKEKKGAFLYEHRVQLPSAHLVTSVVASLTSRLIIDIHYAERQQKYTTDW